MPEIATKKQRSRMRKRLLASNKYNPFSGFGNKYTARKKGRRGRKKDKNEIGMM
jgi:hypothetical protein